MIDSSFLVNIHIKTTNFQWFFEILWRSDHKYKSYLRNNLYELSSKPPPWKYATRNLQTSFFSKNCFGRVDSGNITVILSCASSYYNINKTNTCIMFCNSKALRKKNTHKKYKYRIYSNEPFRLILKIEYQISILYL